MSRDLFKIQHLKAREVIDSRGNPTVEAEIFLEGGIQARASVPSGASTGTHEAVELRDGDSRRFCGRGVRQACRNVEEEILPAIRGLDPAELPLLDARMIELDGTVNKSRLGANAVLAVSFAAAKAGAKLRGMPLWKHLADLYQTPKPYRIPTPLFNVINGGRHADNNLNVQEFMLVPEGAVSFAEAMRLACEVFVELKNMLKERKDSTAVGDEGGFAPKGLKNPEEAIELLILAVERAGHKGKIRLSLDLAASEFAEGENYRLFAGQKALSPKEIIETLKIWAANYPIASMEDPLAEDDWDNWKQLTAAIPGTLLVGDDLFVTNPKRLSKGIESQTANAILIKPNQIGTVSETAEVVCLARSKGYVCIASHRSGETEDAVLAHIAVGLGAEGIKTGSVTRSERLAKYNELLRIEEEIGPASYRATLTAQRLPTSC